MSVDISIYANGNQIFKMFYLTCGIIIYPLIVGRESVQIITCPEWSSAEKIKKVGVLLSSLLIC